MAANGQMPFDPDAILGLIRELSLLTQQQSRWARIGYMMERLVSTSKAITIRMDGEGMHCFLEAQNLRGKYDSKQSPDFEAALTGLLENEEVWRCRTCGQNKPVGDFAVRRNTASGHEQQCKVCNKNAAMVSKQRLRALKP